MINIARWFHRTLKLIDTIDNRILYTYIFKLDQYNHRTRQ